MPSAGRPCAARSSRDPADRGRPCDVRRGHAACRSDARLPRGCRVARGGAPRLAAHLPCQRGGHRSAHRRGRRGARVRLLFDRVAVPVPGGPPTARGRSAGRAPRRVQPVEDRRGAGRPVRGTRARRADDDHPHLLDVRAARRGAGRPTGHDRSRRPGRAPSRPAQPLQPDLRGRLRAVRDPCPGDRRSPTGRRQLGRERDRQCRGLLRVPRRAGWTTGAASSTPTRRRGRSGRT